MRRGKQLVVLTPGKNVKRYVAGAARERARQLERMRLDALLCAHWDRRGEIGSGEIILGISKLRARLEGIDAPSQYVTTRGGAPALHVGRLSVEDLCQLRGLLARAGAKPNP